MAPDIGRVALWVGREEDIGTLLTRALDQHAVLQAVAHANVLLELDVDAWPEGVEGVEHIGTGVPVAATTVAVDEVRHHR